jgi:hypothetical protein
MLRVHCNNKKHERVGQVYRGILANGDFRRTKEESVKQQ